MKVGTRLGLAFALVLALLLVVTTFGIVNMMRMQSRVTEITDLNNVQIRLTTEMRASVADRAIALRNIVLLTDMKEMHPQVERIQRQEAHYKEAKAKLANMYATSVTTVPEEKAALEQLNQIEAEVGPLAAKAAELGLANKAEEATAQLVNVVRPVQAKWMDSLAALAALENKLNDQAAADARAAYTRGRNTMLIIAAIAILAGAGAAFAITRGLLRQLGGEPDYAAAIAGRIADGDLSVEVKVAPNDTTSMLYAMKAMRDRLADIVSDVRTGTDTIATAASQIAAGNADLSSRTEEQAGSLEETASSMEELTATVKQNADNARQANQLTLSAAQVAGKGGAVVTEVVQTMASINESSTRIVDIIAVIDGIAFQTNILALNAAVEAARAGEQGRGFAVVAAEVRTLAQRSAGAAKEIKALIDDSVHKVGTGARLVDEAGATMHEIVASVGRVTDIMAEIMAAGLEQTAGIEQINQAISQMDQVTQQNAALVEEAAAASEAMQDQASQLARLVSVFRLDTRQAAGAAPAARVTQPAAARRAAPVRQAALGAPQRRANAPATTARTAAASAGGDWETF
jgi:methyl-accepting chemotaxis protein